MRRSHLVPLAVLLSVSPAVGQPPARTPAIVDRDAALVAGWMAGIDERCAAANAAFAADFQTAKAIWATVHDKDSAQRAGAQLREILQAERAVLARAKSDLDSYPAIPPNGARIPGVDPAEILASNRSSITQMIQYDDDLMELADAMGKGDAHALSNALRKLAQGGSLIADGRVDRYRNRQATIPADQSAHQVLDIMIALYRAMSIVHRAYFRANFDRQPGQAAAEEKAALAGFADRLQAATRTGRANWARIEQNAVARFSARSGADAARRVARIKAGGAAEEDIFAIGDDLVQWARAEERDAKAAQVGDSSQQTIVLAGIEHRLYAAQARALSTVEGRADQ